MITVRTIDELYKDNYIWINLILNIVNRREEKNCSIRDNIP